MLVNDSRDVRESGVEISNEREGFAFGFRLRLKKVSSIRLNGSLKLVMD